MLGHAHRPEFAAVSPSAWGREAWTPGEPLSRSVCSSERPPGPAQRSGPSFKARGSHFQTHTHHLINSSHLQCKSDLQSPRLQFKKKRPRRAREGHAGRAGEPLSTKEAKAAFQILPDRGRARLPVTFAHSVPPPATPSPRSALGACEFRPRSELVAFFPGSLARFVSEAPAPRLCPPRRRGRRVRLSPTSTANVPSASGRERSWWLRDFGFERGLHRGSAGAGL